MTISNNPPKQISKNRFEETVKYWRTKLESLEELQLPIDFARLAGNGTNRGSFNFSIDSNILSKIEKIGQHPGETLFIRLLAAYKILLYRWSGQEDLCVCLVENRILKQEPNKKFEFSKDIIPIRTQIQSDLDFDNLTKKIHHNVKEAHGFQEVPFESVMERLNHEKDAIFQALFEFESKPKINLEVDKSDTAGGIYQQYSSKCAISFELSETKEGILGVVNYNSHLFKEKTIADFTSHYLKLLASISENSSLPIGRLKILSVEEENTLLHAFNLPEKRLPKDTTILDLFKNQVMKTPDELAVVFENEKVTYRDLDIKSNRLANYLLNKGVKPENLIPICLDNSIEMIIGILGILKSGGAYVPIDPTLPDERIGYVLSDTRAELVLTTSDIAERLQIGMKLVILDSEWVEIEKMRESLTPLDLRQTQPVYVIYTSGSSGKPKGVMIEHKGLLAFLLARESYHQKKAASILLIPPFSFDASIPVIFETLTSGGRLILCKREFIKNPILIKDKLEDSETILCVPSYYRFLLEEDLLAHSRMSKVILAGENLEESLVRLHFEKAKNVPLFNEYGPTECTVWATVSEIKSLNKKISIGKPIDYSSIYILNKENQLNPINVPGELCIAGETVARGYLNLPNLTSEKFTPNPYSDTKGSTMYHTGDLAKWLPDGNIEYLGRIDDQVKIRGYRIELGEIESVLLLHPSVNQAVVMAKENGRGGDKRLVGYVVCSGAFDRESLISFLRSKLPEYMVPALWVELEKIPLTFSGKIDRKALPDIGIDAIRTAEYTPPRTGVEKQLAAVWQNFLGSDRVGIQDDFFALGGNSLLAVKVISALEKEIGSKIAVNQIFKYPNISELAKAIENGNQDQDGWNSLVAIKPKGKKPPFYIVHGVGSTVSIYYSLAKNIENDQPIYGFQPIGLDGKEVPNSSIEEMAAYYISLMVKQNPNGPYNISGYSFGGYVAYEMAQQLRSMGNVVGKLVLFDTTAWEFKEKVSIPEKAKLRLLKTLVDINFAFQEPKGFFERKSRSFKRKRDKILVLLKLKPNPKFLNDSRSVLNRVVKNNANILNKYRLVPYNGPLHLFRAKTRSGYVKESKFYGWKPFVEKVIVINVSGHHDNIFHDPEILKEMAKKIQQVLDENSTS